MRGQVVGLRKFRTQNANAEWRNREPLGMGPLASGPKPLPTGSGFLILHSQFGVLSFRGPTA